jgi:ABC-type transport system involved in cytochrome c biogenesis ATPase subunit
VHDREPTAQVLYGRERKLRLLDNLTGRINDNGAALVVRGEAGIGKPSLLASARLHMGAAYADHHGDALTLRLG